jgi:ankyrin repeat protein
MSLEIERVYKFWISTFILSLLTLSVLAWFEFRPEISIQHFAEEGNIPKLRERLAAGVDVNEVDRDGFTALACAVRSDQTAAVTLLVNAGADVSKPCIDGKTPLHLAVEQSNVSLTQFLLKQGADPYYENADEMSPFHLAVENNSPVVEVFLEWGVNPAELTIPRSGGFLFCAAQSGCMPVLYKLLETGVDVNGLSSSGATALHYAAYGEQIEAAQLLIKSAADVNAPDSHQWAPMHQAVRSESTAMIRLLAENGANLEIPDKNGYTPLLLAAKIGSLDCVRELLDLSADINAVDSAGRTIEDLARACRDEELVEFIAGYRKRLKGREADALVSF